MLKKIEREKKMAQHLFYTSLKYTKTTDLMISIMKRWASTIEETINACLAVAKKKKLISDIPSLPKLKIETMKKLFKKEEIVQKMLELYEIFRNVDSYEKIRENEFRKNVVLKLAKEGINIKIDLSTLEEWEKIFEEYIKIVEKFLLSK
jgi:hypothetical protein